MAKVKDTKISQELFEPLFDMSDESKQEFFELLADMGFFEFETDELNDELPGPNDTIH